jgi:DNA-directed RNA polymerase subunit RPC12/RpoP
MQEFICNRCSGKVIQDHTVDEIGEGAWWYICQKCGRHFGRPIYDRDVEFSGSLDNIDPGLEPWVETRRQVA